MRCHCFSKKICFNQHDCVFMFQLECFCKAGKAKGSRDPRVASPPQQRKPNLCSGLLNFYFLNFKETYAIQSDRRDFPLLVVPPRKRGQLWEVWGQGGWSGWSWRPWSRREPPSRWRCSSRRWSRRWRRRQPAPPHQVWKEVTADDWDRVEDHGDHCYGNCLISKPRRLIMLDAK